MKKYVIVFILISIFSEVYTQFFIPIVIPYSLNSYRCKSKDQKALDHYATGLENFPEKPSVSIAYFNESIKSDSFFCDAYYAIIQAYIVIKNYPKAMEYNELALKINAIQPWVLTQKGLLFMRMHEYQKASDFFFNMIELQPREAIWQYFFAESLIKLNLPDSAQKETIKLEYLLNQQQGWDPKLTSYYLQGKIAYYKKEYEKSFRALSEIKGEYKRNPDFNYHYGLVLLQMDEKNRARRFIRKACRLGYEDADQELIQFLGI